MPNLKHQIIEYSERKKYFSLSSLKEYLENKELQYSQNSIKQSMHDLKESHIIFDAGRGWYSTIKEDFVLDKDPIKELVKKIRLRFPFLPFSCWSTAQVKYYFHHMLTKFVTMFYTEKDALQPVSDFFYDHDYRVFLNPNKPEVDKFFFIEDKTVVLRPHITEEPVVDHFAEIEKILVDMYLEKDRLYLMDGSEYRRVFNNIVFPKRINIGRLLRYSRRREVNRYFMKELNILTAA